MAFLKNIFKGKQAKEPKKPAPAIRESEVSARTDRSDGQDAGPSVTAPTSPILRSFHVSEKSSRGMAMNQYTFIVDPQATQTQVRDAVHRSYKVDVVSVNMVTLPAKKRTIGRYRGVVAARHKAIVTLKEGQSIAAAQA